MKNTVKRTAMLDNSDSASDSADLKHTLGQRIAAKKNKIVTKNQLKQHKIARMLSKINKITKIRKESEKKEKNVSLNLLKLMEMKMTVQMMVTRMMQFQNNNPKDVELVKIVAMTKKMTMIMTKKMMTIMTKMLNL